MATIVKDGKTIYAVGNASISKAATDGSKVTVTRGETVELTDIPTGVEVTNNTSKAFTVNGNTIAVGKTETAKPAPTPSTGGYYYYPSTTTNDTTKGSPKTFDAGVGIYAVTAVLSVTGMAWTAKKRGN